MPNSSVKSKAVVVGAGPGGLASAMMLAKAGMDVTVLERLPQVGGRTATLHGDGGYKFDIGPTFFLFPRVLEEIYASCGYHLRSEVEMKRLDPQYRLIFGAGGQIDATADHERMTKAIAAISPRDARAFQGFMKDNREKMAAFRPILEQPFNSATDILSRNALKAAPKLRPWRSVWSDLGRHFKDERVRLAFTFQAKYLGMSPYKCPSLFSILSFLEYEYGVWHPMGGCGAVSRSMADIAQELGADIRLDESVEEIIFDGKTAVGVRTREGVYPCDALVVNADFALGMKNLVPDHLRSRWTDKKIQKKKFSCSTFMLYLGLDGTCPDLAHHTIYFSSKYKENLKQIEERHELTSDDPSFYVQNACRTDPSLAPHGKSALYILVPVTHQHRNVDWPREQRRYREVALKQLQKLGLYDIQSRIRYEKIMTPDDWSNDFQLHLGSTFNLAHNFGQMLHNRPRNRFEDLEGVYLAGGGTHPGSGLPVIYEGARISSRLLLQDLGQDTTYLDEPQRTGLTYPMEPMRTMAQRRSEARSETLAETP